MITAAFTGAPLTAVSVKVDGAVVSSGQDGVVITGTPGTLAAGVHTVIVTATNAGGTTSKGWTFTSAAAAVVGSECSQCHADKATGHFTLNCTFCHTNPAALHRTAHDHIDKTKSSACTACHGNNYYTVGSWDSLDEDVRELQVPARPSDPAQEHAGCSCHAYGYGRPDGVGDPTRWPKDECVDCHSGSHAAHGFGGAASGHSTTSYGVKGAFEWFDGRTGSPDFGEGQQRGHRHRRVVLPERSCVLGQARDRQGWLQAGQRVPWCRWPGSYEGLGHPV